MAAKASSKGKKAAGKKFSAVSAIKRNARDRIGQPPPEKVIAPRTADDRRAKHKPSLTSLQDTEPEG